MALGSYLAVSDAHRAPVRPCVPAGHGRPKTSGYGHSLENRHRFLRRCRAQIRQHGGALFFDAPCAVKAAPGFVAQQHLGVCAMFVTSDTFSRAVRLGIR